MWIVGKIMRMCEFGVDSDSIEDTPRTCDVFC